MSSGGWTEAPRGVHERRGRGVRDPRALPLRYRKRRGAVLHEVRMGLPPLRRIAAIESGSFVRAFVVLPNHFEISGAHIR